MNRWEQARWDAALDDSSPVMRGCPCPVCGDATTEGTGPCSTACEALFDKAERRREIREEAADEERGEREVEWAEGFR